jgi:hypothetical protein
MLSRPTTKRGSRERARRADNLRAWDKAKRPSPAELPGRISDPRQLELPFAEPAT